MNYHSAGAIIVRKEKGEWRFLVIQQRRKTGQLQWVVPKGRLEKGESPEQAAAREVFEETGLQKCEKLGYIGQQAFSYVEPDGSNHHKTIDWFVFLAQDTSEVKLNTGEGFLSAAWLPFETAKSTLSHPSFLEFMDRSMALLTGS